jgi:hypothetical protein
MAIYDEVAMVRKLSLFGKRARTRTPTNAALAKSWPVQQAVAAVALPWWVWVILFLVFLPGFLVMIPVQLVRRARARERMIAKIQAAEAAEIARQGAALAAERDRLMSGIRS